MMPDRQNFFPYIVAARRKLGVGEQWEWRSLEAVDKTGQCNMRDTIVTGGVPHTSGPEAKRWKGVPVSRVLVTDADVQAAIDAFEEETGKCAECSGYGTRACGWSAESGTRYRPCEKCGGTGKPLRAAPSEHGREETNDG